MKYKREIFRGLQRVLDFVYPRKIYCIICGIGILPKEKFSVCERCRRNVPLIEGRTCLCCGKPMESSSLEICSDCLEMERHFSRGFSCAIYEGKIRELIHRFKYGKQKHLVHALAEMMTDKLNAEELTDIDRVIPVPLHKERQKERGFNQSEMLARYIAGAMGWKLDKKSLLRNKNTHFQSELTKEERKQNVQNAFSLNTNVSFEGEKILIVDDVYTTGSTLNACAKELSKANPEEIYVISLAIVRHGKDGKGTGYRPSFVER
jgi:competence protein ComFC